MRLIYTAKGIICSSEEREELMESHAPDETVGISTENNYKRSQESKHTSAWLEFLLCLSFTREAVHLAGLRCTGAPGS